MPSAEEQYPARKYRVFIQEPAIRIEEDLNKESGQTLSERDNYRKSRLLSEKGLNFCQHGLNFVLCSSRHFH